MGIHATCRTIVGSAEDVCGLPVTVVIVDDDCDEVAAYCGDHGVVAVVNNGRSTCAVRVFAAV